MPKMRMSGTSRAGDATRVIRDTAARLFRKKGFTATTLREIAVGADILPGSLHYRFPSKTDLLLDLMDHAVATTSAQIREATSEVRDPGERLRVATRRYLEVLHSGDDSLYVLLYDWRALEGTEHEKVVLLHDRLNALFDGLLYEAAGAGYLPAEVDLHLLRELWLGALNWTVQSQTPPRHTSPSELADQYWTLLTAGWRSRPDVGVVAKDELERLAPQVDLRHDAPGG